jgi:hypothetical protein
MEADYAVELGPDEETLELPWAAADGGPRYYDLKRHPEQLSEVSEAQQVRELAEFLATVNTPTSILETAKCDTWTSTDINPEEEMFGGSLKFGSYVDLLFSERQQRLSFPEHEAVVKELIHILKPAPPILASAEFLIRRCYYHEENEIHEGCYITFYLFGYGNDEADARNYWATGLKLVENAIRSISF